MNNQEAFNKIVTHLRKQGQKSVVKHPGRTDDICMYRGLNGMSCSVGCLIPDDIYSPEMEDTNVRALLERFPKVAEHLKDVDLIVLVEMQAVHDRGIPDEWEDKFVSVGARLKLDVPEKV